MSKHRIPVYKAERDDGLTSLIQEHGSIAYVTPLEPLPDSPAKESLHRAFAAEKGNEDQFDLYYLKDLLVTTCKNKNKDIFDKVEVWAARHTSEDKPFNFEHRPLDIIGHITDSRAVDDAMADIDESTPVDELPAKYHILNSSVLYMALADDERRKLMQQTVAEIKKGEWYVSMECLFRGFDYGVETPDGKQSIVTRTEATAFLTKHLAQYGGTGVWKDEKTGTEYSLGRVLRNITFSGKGLVRKPANPESIIFNSVAAFDPGTPVSGYLTTAPVATSSETEESDLMPESNATDQSLRDENRRLEKAVETLQSEVAGLKSKDTELTISKLQQDVKDRDATIAAHVGTITGLNTQITAITESSKALEKRAEKAETDLEAAKTELNGVKAAETKRAREAVLRDKHAPAEAIATLVEQFSVLDDAAFAKTVETIAASWKKPEAAPAPKPKADPVVAGIKTAIAETEPTLVTASEDTREAATAAIADFLGKSLKSARGGRPSIYAANTAE